MPDLTCEDRKSSSCSMNHNISKDCESSPTYKLKSLETRETSKPGNICESCGGNFTGAFCSNCENKKTVITSEENACKRNQDVDTKGQDQKTVAKRFPDHIDPLKHPMIPYPLAAARVELRGGNLIHMCWCLKKNGLQSDCPYTGCQGNKECIKGYLPACIPSGFGLPELKPSYLQKSEGPECYSKTELVKAYDKVMMETQTGGTGGIEGDGIKTIVNGVYSAHPSIHQRQSTSSVSSTSIREETKIVVRLKPNSPPNYIDNPPVETYLAPCRKHGKYGVPGSRKYRLKRVIKTQ